MRREEKKRDRQTIDVIFWIKNDGDFDDFLMNLSRPNSDPNFIFFVRSSILIVGRGQTRFELEPSEPIRIHRERSHAAFWLSPKPSSQLDDSSTNFDFRLVRVNESFGNFDLDERRRRVRLNRRNECC